MKKTLLCAVMVLSLFSCKKETHVLPSGRSQAPVNLARDPDPEEANFDDMIETASIGLLEIRRNATFRGLVRDQVALQFDGDDDVLLLTLDSVCTANGMSLRDSMIASLTHASRTDLLEFVDSAVLGFTYNDGYVYLQIFAPYINLIDQGDVPIIAANHDGDPEIAGWDVDLSNTDIVVDDEMAQTDHTWVVSANEWLPVDWRPGATIGSVEGRELHPGAESHTVRISYLHFDDYHEPYFPNGSPEFNYAMYRHESGSCVNYGYRMKFIYGALERDNGVFTVKSDAIEAWLAPIEDPIDPTAQDEPQIYVLYYEKDRRKKFDRTEQVVSGCSNTTVTYCSKEEKYGINVVDNPWYIYSTTNFESSLITSNLDAMAVKYYFE